MSALKQQAAMDEAVIAAVNGDFDGARIAMHKAEDNGASTGWIRMMRGQVALYQEEPQNAVGHLERAVALLPDSVAAKGLLAIARVHAGQGGLYTSQLQLEHLHPVTALDHAFKGLVLCYARPTVDGLRLLDTAIKLRKSSVTQLFRADARAKWAMMTFDPADSDDAILYANIAKGMLPGNAWAIRTHLETQMVAATVFDANGLVGKHAVCMRTAAEDAESLKQFGRNSQAQFALARYFMFVGQEDKAFALASKASFWRISSSYLYRHGAFEEALLEIERIDSAAEETFAQTARGLIQTELPDGQGLALATYDSMMSKASTIQEILYLQNIPLLLGMGAKAAKACQDARSRPGMDLLSLESPWYQNLLDFAADAFPADDLLQAAKSSRMDQCEAHFLIAMKFLSSGNRESAAVHFRKALDTRAFYYIEYDWSRAFLARLSQDQEWPPWIP